MPPKKRLKGALPGAKMGKSFGRKPNCREVEVQTDAEFGILLESMTALSAGESSSGDRVKGDSAVLLRRQNILMMQLRKVGKQNREMRTVIAKYEQIPNLLQAIKVHYESTFNSIKDDIAMLVFEQQNRGTKLLDHVQKQKGAIERLIAIKDEKLKSKEEKNKALKDEKKLLNESLELLQEALEFEQRRVQVAVKEQCNALDEMQEIRQKMEDKLFLAANQRCSTCQTRERVQDELTGQIAGKLHQIEEFRKLLLMKDDAIVEKDRINQILINELEKKRGECKDKAFAANSYQAELVKQQRKLKQAQIEIQQLRARMSSSNNNNSTTSHEQLPNPHILTPPEEESGAPLVPLPSVAKGTANGRSEQQRIGNRTEQNATGKGNAGEKFGGSEVQNAKTPTRNTAKEESALSAFGGKRPRVVPSPANDGNAPLGMDNGGVAFGTERQSLAQRPNDKPKNGKDSDATAAGEEANDREKGAKAVVPKHCFFSPPPMKRRNSNNALSAAPPILQQQQMARPTRTPPEGVGTCQQQQQKGNTLNQQQQEQQQQQQQQGAIVSKSWRPVDKQPMAPQNPLQQQRQQVVASQMPQPRQQLQQPPLRHSLPSGGPMTSANPIAPPALQSSYNRNILLSNNNNSAAFRKFGGATIDDFCGGPVAPVCNNNNNNSSTKGRIAAPSPVCGGSAELMSGTWRKSVPGNSFVSRPSDALPDAFANHQMLRERIEQKVRMAVASRVGAAPNPSVAPVAALPPMYACQQQNFPPPRPSAPIPRPPVRPFVQPPTFNGVKQFAAQAPHLPQIRGGVAPGSGSSLPWHSHSSGTFPCTTSQQSHNQQHYSTSQFFIR